VGRTFTPKLNPNPIADAEDAPSEAIFIPSKRPTSTPEAREGGTGFGSVFKWAVGAGLGFFDEGPAKATGILKNRRQSPNFIFLDERNIPISLFRILQ
jgi:hypothetical protein